MHFELLNKNLKHKQSLNHIPYHSELTIKSKLHINLKKICLKHNIDLDIIIPQTFIIDFNSDKFEEEITKFVNYYGRVSMNVKK